MKNTRKLIPAFAMLLVSAVMMSTASFAWFSMNTTVTASNMQITAKNESKYLQIVAGAATEFDDSAQIAATATKASNILRPTALVSEITGEGTGITAYAGGTNLVWAEAFSNDPDVNDKATDNKYVNVTSAAIAEDASNVYTLYNIFKVRMNPTTGVTDGGALNVTNVKITATGTGFENLLPAVRVAIIGTTAGAIYNSEGRLVSGSATIMDTVTDTPSQIKVFVFFDGEDDAATTNNVAEGASYSVEFTLGIA